MRIERSYWLTGRGGERDSHYIECQETRFCEDPTCEAQHEDPATLWDTKSVYTVGEAYGRERGQRILDALQAAEAR